MAECYTCEFCHMSFTTKSNLVAHKKYTKKCLKLQNKQVPTDFLCEKCGKVFTSKSTLILHVEKCEEKSYLSYIELETKYKDLETKYKILETVLIEKNKQIEQLINPPTKRRNKHKLLDTLIPYDLNDEMINTIVNTSYTKQHLKNANQGAAEFIIKNILTLHDRRK